MKNRLAVLFLILVVATSLIGCSGGGGGDSISISNTPTIAATPPYPINDSSAKELSRDVNVAISDFSGKHIYTLNTPVLTSKPEGDSTAYLTQYGYSITSVATSSPSESHTVNQSNLMAKSQSVNLRYNGQRSFDLIMREKENILLSKKMPQFDKSTKFLANRPSVITDGTTWDDVNITLNGKTIDTTCKRVSNHAYFFVDNRDISKMEPYMDSYATAFESIYDTDRNHFGTENDVDKNGKIIIIFSEALESEQGLLGYFYAGDKYPSSSISDSNNGDIIYLTANQSAGYQGETMCATMAHEFQHMIYFDEHARRGVTSTYTWLNESLSQAAEYYNGYLQEHHNWIRAFLYSDPIKNIVGWSGLSLTYWSKNNYGYSALFIRYLIDQYGDTAIKNMCATSKVGIAAVEAATGNDFNTIFVNFTRALVLSGISADPKYNFTSPDLKAIQSENGKLLTTCFVYGPGVTDRAALYPYEINFDSWTGSINTIKLSGNYQVGTVFGLSQ